MPVETFRTRYGREIAVSSLCDGGDQGCGGGLLMLMLQAMKRLEPGRCLKCVPQMLEFAKICLPGAV